MRPPRSSRCSRPHDLPEPSRTRPSYWAPTLLDGGEPVEPTLGTAYYRAAPGVDPTEVGRVPAGLEDHRRRHDRRPETRARSTSPAGPAACHLAVPPNRRTAPRSAPLRAVITFPDCWDGERVDSADHRSHVANSADGACPDSHPVHVPQLTFAITYPITRDRPRPDPRVRVDLRPALGLLQRLGPGRAARRGRAVPAPRCGVRAVVEPRPRKPLFSG